MSARKQKLREDLSAALGALARATQAAEMARREVRLICEVLQVESDAAEEKLLMLVGDRIDV